MSRLRADRGKRTVRIMCYVSLHSSTGRTRLMTKIKEFPLSSLPAKLAPFGQLKATQVEPTHSHHLFSPRLLAMGACPT